jgi:hypothetical protein
MSVTCVTAVTFVPCVTDQKRDGRDNPPIGLSVVTVTDGYG